MDNMAIRKIKDAKDLSDDSLIYFKGHAKATYMSDGSTVEDAIKNIETNNGNIDLSDYETKEDSISKLQEAKDYTDIKTDELRDVVTQTLSLRAVGSMWCSFYVDITLEQLQQALGTNATSITTSFDGNTEVTSSYDANTNTWSGDLTTLDITKMYQIYLNTDCEIHLTGRKIPNSTIYTLNPGWNWIGYPVVMSATVEEALANHVPTDGDTIKSKSFYSEYFEGEWWPSFNLQAGQGYMYQNTSTEPKILVFNTELIDTKSELNRKQGIITDLETIRQGASKGATALQSIPSEYVTETELSNKGYATISALNNKVDIINGKQLSTEDFTTALKTKLEGLNNYDDTELSNAIETLRGDFDKIVSGDTTTAIKTFNEVIAFLDGLTDTQDLESIIASIEQQIAGKADNNSVVHIAGEETITGVKTFNGRVNFLGSGDSNAMYLSTNTRLNVNGTTNTVLGFSSGTFLINNAAYNLTLRGKGTRPTYNSTTLALSSDIPAEVTENTVSGWGFTKNTGTYNKPSTGIPKTDLASAVQTSLGKADTALQEEQYKGTVTGVKINGTTKNPSSGVVDLGTVITSHQDISGKQDKLISGTNIKTINGESLLGNGDLEIQEFKTYTFNYNSVIYEEKTITQEELNEILESDNIYIKHNNVLVKVTVKNESNSNLFLIGYNNSLESVHEYRIHIDKINLKYDILDDFVILATDSDLEGFYTQIYYNEISCSNIEDGVVV